MALQHLRSSTADKRPDPTAMSDGQLAVNTNAASTGLFYKTSTGGLVKAGPTHVGTTAPNSTPASGGATGNSVGETWLDTSGATPVLKVWDGSAWQAGQAASGGTVTSVDVIGGTGLTSSGGPITTSGSITVDLDNTAVTPGSYTYASITVDQQGRLTAASNGTAPLTSSDIGVTVQGYDADTAKLDVAQTFTAAQTLAADLTLNAQSDLRFADADSSNWVAFQAPATVASNVTWTLPNADGTSGQVLSTDGSGTLSWATAAGGGASVTTSDTAPSSPSDGDLWYDSVGGRTYVYYDDGNTSQWVDAAPQGGGGSGTSITTGNTTAEVIDTGSDGRFVVTTEGTERLRVDANGRLGIGTASPGSLLEIKSPDQNPNVVRLYNAYNAGGSSWGIDFYRDSDSGTNLAVAEIKAVRDGGEVTDLKFGTSSTSGTVVERMRIQSNGRVRCHADADGFDFKSATGAGTSVYLQIGVHSSTSTTSGGTASYYVWTNGNVQNTNNSYTGISDIKLKENIVDANSQWDDIKALRPVNYNFKPETGHETFTQLGLIAQEVEQVSPGLVSETPDRDEEGNDLGTVTKSVNYSVLYMKAVKALQEAMERIETLEAQNASLETQNASFEARLTALEGGN